MKRAGVAPTIISYNALMSACERAGEPERALEVMNAMKRKAGAPRPNSVTYNTLLSACAKAERYNEALAVYEEMQAAGLREDVFTLTALITACERVGDWEQARRFFHEFRARGVQPNTVAYNQLIAALGAGGRWRAALVAFQDMRAPADGSAAVEPDIITFGSLISALEKSGQWEEALEVYEGMCAAGMAPNQYIFASMLNACEQGRQWDRAKQLFQDMQRQNDIPMDSLGFLARKALYVLCMLRKTTPKQCSINNPETMLQNVFPCSGKFPFESVCLHVCFPQRSSKSCLSYETCPWTDSPFPLYTVPQVCLPQPSVQRACPPGGCRCCGCGQWKGS